MSLPEEQGGGANFASLDKDLKQYKKLRLVTFMMLLIKFKLAPVQQITTLLGNEHSTIYQNWANNWAATWVIIWMVHLAECYYHVTYTF